MVDKRAKVEPTLRSDASEIEQAFFKYAKDLTAKVRFAPVVNYKASDIEDLSMIVMSAWSS